MAMPTVGGDLIAGGRLSFDQREPDAVVDLENGCGSCGAVRGPIELFGLEVMRAGRTGRGRGPRAGLIRLCRRCLRVATELAA